MTKKEIAAHKTTHKIPNGHSFDYNKITNEIYLGTNACCTMGFEEELLKKKIFADISLEKERVDNPEGVDYFLWLPVVDETAPTQKQLQLGVQTIHYLVTNKVKVYIHCMNGHGRAPTLLAAYFIATGMGVDEAIKFIKDQRSSIHPNKIQKAALKKFKATKVKL